MDLATHAYIGLRPSDGVVIGIVFDDPGLEKATARIVASWIKEGKTVERLPYAEAVSRMPKTIGE